MSLAVGTLDSYGKMDAIFRETRLNAPMQQLYETESPGITAAQGFSQKVKVGPKGLTQTFKTGQIGAMTFIVPGGDYPMGIESRYEKTYIYLTESAASLEIDRFTMLALQQGPEGDKDINFGQKVEDVVTMFAQDREAHFWGNGNGAVATTSGVTASTTTRIYFETVPNGTSPGLHYGAEFVRPLTKYDLINEASPTSPVATGIQFKEGFIVKDANPPYADLTVALGGAPAAGLKLVPTGSYGLAFKGMAYMARYPRPTYWQGIYSVGRPEWNGVYVDAGGREFSLAIRRRLQDKMTLRFGKPMTDGMYSWMHPAQETNWTNSGYGFIRLSAPPESLDMEIKTGKYRGSIFEIFPKCDPDTIYIGKKSAHVYAYLDEPKWVKEDGQTMRIKRDSGGNGNNASAFSMVYSAIDQFGVKEPTGLHCITNLGVGAGVTYGNMRLGT